jgi:hypothetical protein
MLNCSRNVLCATFFLRTCYFSAFCSVFIFASAPRLNAQQTYSVPVVVEGGSRIYAGGSDGNTSYGDFRTNTGSGNTIISAPTGAVFLNYDHGTGGVNFCNGVGGVEASVSATGSANFNGAVAIGTTAAPSGYQLAVNGSAIFVQAVVQLYTNWPDYVFKKGYQLPALGSLEQYINANHHLPEMPTADAVAAKGLNLGDNQAKLLKKIEELTLYAIDQQKEIELLKDKLKSVESLQSQIDELKALIKK